MAEEEPTDLKVPENEVNTNEDMEIAPSSEWSKEDLEKLRLCRNRAYYKVNSKRRQHLQASLSTYLQKEWLNQYPDTGLSAKDLLKVYQDNFEPENKRVTTYFRGRGRGRGIPRGNSRKVPEIAKNELVETNIEVRSGVEDHSDKQWSETMMENLMTCHHLVTERQELGDKTDVATLLHAEWKNIYPHSTLSARNIKSRLTVYMKTIGEVPPPSKRRKITAEIKTEDESISTVQVKNEVVDEFAPDTEMSNGQNIPHSICKNNHWVHLFSDRDINIECILTEQLLQIRNSLKDSFEGCDIYKPRKPKGLSSTVLEEWKRHYPNSEETNKTIGFKLAKYDRGPVEKVKVSPSGRIFWTPIMLQKLQETRQIAQSLVAKSSGLSLTRAWKDEWKKAYPDLEVDWRTVLSRYNYHFGSLDSLNVQSETKVEFLDNEVEKFENGGKVKGFRNWTAQMEQDLVETNVKVISQNPELDKGSSEFNRILLKEFLQLYPKCMESSRSLYSKLQSVEKDSQLTRTYSTESQTSVPKEEPVTVKEEPEAIDEKQFGPSKIEGFEDWNLPMIRDFIGCMDTARKKYATLKEQDPEGQVKLVPLLLDEWKIIYPESNESVKTFLVKIKHLKTQKEIIKKDLGVSGLLPNIIKSEDEAVKTEIEAEEIKVEPQQPKLETEEEEPFKWHRDMIPDVIESRKNALRIKDEQLGLGKKVSFHYLWASEFRKIHPTSTFTSNNLSVHFWTWRKQQQKLQAQSRKQNKSNENQNRQKRLSTSGGGNGTFKDPQAREKLMEIGRRVEQMLQNSETPNELKLKGFANVLHEEWMKENINSPESSRSLNMMYSRLLRLDDPIQQQNSVADATICATWTPKHNGVLKTCLDANHRKEEESHDLFMARIIKSWRSKFPKSSVLDEDLIKRIEDLTSVKVEGEPDAEEDLAMETKRQLKRKWNDTENVRQPNSRGQMNWNNLAIRDLIECHQSAQQEHKNQKSQKLSDLVHEKFLALHPYCKLSPAILMTKCYNYKSAVEKGMIVFDLKQEDQEEVVPAKITKRSSSRDFVLRTWTQEMIDNMLKTRKIALQRKKKEEKVRNTAVNLTDLWYEEFLKLHPEYKSSKKNLWRKYRWYKSKMVDETKPEVKEEAKEEKITETAPLTIDFNQQPLLKMKNIRKDVFHFLKAVMEEARIFLPTKLPEDSDAQPEMKAFQTLASFHQQAMLEATHEPVQQQNSSIKLPGGATLVAVTDRNADMLLKPKQLEKPHVTITIGDKQIEQPMMTAIMSTPTTQLNFPNLVQPPPLSQLKPLDKIPPKIRQRMNDFEMSDEMFEDLLNIFETVREEYIELLKKGFLVFFPYMLGTRWREKRPKSTVTGRKLTSLVDLYVEEKRRGRIVSPEYLSKNPCGFELTELVLKQILVCYAESKRQLLGVKNEESPVDIDTQAWIYLHMIHRWQKIHPEIKLTVKQMLSIHHMLNFEPGKDDPSPFIICHLTESLRKMDREVPENRQFDVEIADEEKLVEYDESNLSMEYLQELFLCTQGLKKANKIIRPRFVIGKRKFFWTQERVFNLKIASQMALQRFKINKKTSIGDLLFKYWMKLNPDCLKLKKSEVLARHKFQLRHEKRSSNEELDSIVQNWEVMCSNYRLNEENIEVIDEESNCKTDIIPLPATTEKTVKAGVQYNSDVANRDYNKDEDVLSYLKDQQASSKAQHNITWTPDVMADLISARREARRRKKTWEEWAIREFGGVGIAYNNPNVNFTKVDDMFKEEWAKRRPNLANLSIWTLVSYARKFDTLKKQLVMSHNQIYRGGDRRRKDFVDEDDFMTPERALEKTSSIVYFHDSAIPKYDLEEVKNLKIPTILANLIISRQNAKILQEKEDNFLSFDCLWSQEWFKLENETVSSQMLHQKLFLLENHPGIKSKLKQAVLRSSNASQPKENEEEVMKIRPRKFVFPEAEEEGLNIFCYVDVPLAKGQKERWYVELERDVYNKDFLMIPMLEDGRGPADEEEEVIKFPAKAYKHLEQNYADLPKIKSTDSENYECQVCGKPYTNVNNLKYHLELHSEVNCD